LILFLRFSEKLIRLELAASKLLNQLRSIAIDG